MRNMYKPNYSLKHLLNRNLKPVIDPIDSNIKLYPVYIQLIYKRKNYLFKSIVSSYYTELSYITQGDAKLIAYELNFLNRIILFEIENNKEKFDVPGFANRYEKYRRSVVIEAERLLIGKIEGLVISVKSRFRNVFNFNYAPGKFVILLESCQILVPEILKSNDFKILELASIFWRYYQRSFPEKENYGLLFPMIIDWLDGDHYKLMADFIKSNMSGRDAKLLLEYLNEFDFALRAQTINA